MIKGVPALTDDQARLLIQALRVVSEKNKTKVLNPIEGLAVSFGRPYRRHSLTSEGNRAGNA